MWGHKVRKYVCDTPLYAPGDSSASGDTHTFILDQLMHPLPRFRDHKQVCDFQIGTTAAGTKNETTLGSNMSGATYKHKDAYVEKFSSFDQERRKSLVECV